MARPGAPGKATFRKGLPGAHAYFERLSARPDVFAAYPLRSQAEIDSYKEAASTSTKRLPIVYDAVQDAAQITINPTVSTDAKGRYLPLKVQTGSFLLTFDFLYDKGFTFTGDGDISHHKTWRFNPGPIWLAIRTDYRHAFNQGQFSEVFFTSPGAKYVVPGESWRVQDDPGNPKNLEPWHGEMIQPRVGVFYFTPETWTRLWIFFEGLDQPVGKLSAWAADEARDPVLLIDRIGYKPVPTGLVQFFIEYDTSSDVATKGALRHAWNRNAVVLKDIVFDDVEDLLEKPKR